MHQTRTEPRPALKPTSGHITSQEAPEVQCRPMVLKWEGDLFGRGCLIWWVVSRPTASLTPH